MKLLEFFQEDNGNLSNARLANFIIVGCFGADWVMHIVRNSAFDPSFSIVGIVTAIMGIKVAQKYAERNGSNVKQ